jgi:branched-chain amino acid transport system ATP-binding protein
VYDRTPILQAKSLCSGYGRSQVLFDVDLTAGTTGVLAILGRNGAGKTTLLKTLVGELKPMRGNIEFDQSEARYEPTEVRVRRGLGYVPQEDAVFGSLTVRENLKLGAIRQKADGNGIDEALALFPKLGQRLNQTAATLSGGERKMLAISRALISRPKLLLLDEPTEGVWIGVIEEIAERLIELGRQLSIVLVEQHLEMALRVAQTAHVLDRGRFVLGGPSAEVRDNPQLLRYLAP